MQFCIFVVIMDMPAGLQDYTYLNNYPIKMREILGLAVREKEEEKYYY